MSRTLPPPGRPEEVLPHVGPHTDVILPLANGEPVGLMDTLEEHAGSLEGVRVHQMHALHERPYIHGAFGGRLRHVSYFLSSATRQATMAREGRREGPHGLRPPAAHGHELTRSWNVRVRAARAPARARPRPRSPRAARSRG
jgi:hypothetical protein